MSDTLTVRVVAPARSQAASQQTYQAYRQDLRKDFFNACGYCGDEDERVDSVVFHIDHFAPKTRFPTLELVYDNLVYACRYCNVSKSDHWVGTDATVPHDGRRGFIDPCAADYEKHIQRQSTGRIVGKSELGSYIVKRLRLGLIRHELLWQARRSRNLRLQVERLLDELETRGLAEGSEHHQLLKRYRTLTKSLEDYELRAHA